MPRAGGSPLRVTVRTLAAIAALASAVFFGAVERPTLQSAAPADVEQQARTTCGTCHAVPPPEILPRDAWRDEFVRMMFIRENRLPPIGPPEKVYASVQLPPDMAQLLPFYTSRAPAKLPAPESWPLTDGPGVRFVRQGLNVNGMAGTPAVSHVQLVDLDGDKRLDLLGADMRQGIVFSATPAAGAKSLSVVASIPHPAHVTVADVDGDGVQDLLVGDLGEFFPADHDKGAVIWMRGQGGGKYGAFWLDGWPRVAGVDAADFNGDGRPDLAIGAFGWRRTGRVSVMENKVTNVRQPVFTEHVIDKRSGSIAAVPVDLNRDGKMDLVTLLAQEHETVLAYLNKGAGDFTFEQKVIYAAPHPNWGSSGIRLVDLDKDGDADVLFTHGDTFDDGVVKPYHGIQWLENTGGFPFVEHTIAQLPGAHHAEAADLDGDGDLDIAACALLAGGADVDERTLPALVWLEQTRPGTFVRHTIEMGFPRHATLHTGDIDGDGDVDLVTGTFAIGKAAGAAVDVWLNESKSNR